MTHLVTSRNLNDDEDCLKSTQREMEAALNTMRVDEPVSQETVSIMTHNNDSSEQWWLIRPNNELLWKIKKPTDITKNKLLARRQKKKLDELGKATAAVRDHVTGNSAGKMETIGEGNSDIWHPGVGRMIAPCDHSLSAWLLFFFVSNTWSKCGGASAPKTKSYSN